jgi:hypothetical protein
VLVTSEGGKEIDYKAQTAYEIKIRFAGTGKKDPLCGIKEKSGEDGILVKRKKGLDGTKRRSLRQGDSKWEAVFFKRANY